MKKNTVSIATRLILLMLILGVLALIALSSTTRIATDTKGSTYMINQLGLLRMKNYQLLSMIPLQPQQYSYLDIFSNIPLDSKYQSLLQRYQLLDEFEQLKQQWQQEMIPKIKNTSKIVDLKEDTAKYVAKIDFLVHKIELKTEQQIVMISRVQMLFIVIIIIFLMIEIYYLRRYLLTPWRQLLTMAESIANHNFSQRFTVKHKKINEFDMLGIAFNNMSNEISSQYLLLEERVKDKTAKLQQKNDIVLFLYNATKQLHTSLPLCERFLKILYQLESLTPLSHFQIRFYEPDDPTNFQLVDYNREKKLSYCQDNACSACLISSKTISEQHKKRVWHLHDKENRYGIIFAQQPQSISLSDEQEQLVLSIVEQMTMTIALERQIEQQKQLLLMTERSAMARELHDSIAQSLSCLKIYVSCLQMQSDLICDESKILLQTMRKEITVAYSQLRELITTFKLQVSHASFYSNLTDLVEEFNQKLGFNIKLNYSLPLNIITSQHSFHLLQIIREALNNIYKHAKATAVEITLTLDEEQVISLWVKDNGVGFNPDSAKNEHYGLTIMRDRAELLHGFFAIESQLNQGTEIHLSFKGRTDINN